VITRKRMVPMTAQQIALVRLLASEEMVRRSDRLRQLMDTLPLNHVEVQQQRALVQETIGLIHTMQGMRIERSEAA
jgi:hypothetical protein